MSHGPHHDCLMCSMAKTVGMIEKHPENCDCEEAKKEELKHEHKKAEDA